jgi:hypothetical protein
MTAVGPQQKVAVRQLRRDMRTFAQAWGRSSRGFDGIFERLQETRRGGRLKKETACERTSIAPLAGPSPPLAPRSPSRPLPAQGSEGARERCLNPCVDQLTTQRLIRSACGTACALGHTPRCNPRHSRRPGPLETVPPLNPPPLAGPSPPLAPRSILAIPTCPRGRRGQGMTAQPSCRSTDDPMARRERMRPAGFQ